MALSLVIHSDSWGAKKNWSRQKCFNHSLQIFLFWCFSDLPRHCQRLPAEVPPSEALIASQSAVHRRRDQPKLTSHWYGPIDKALIRMSKNVLKCHRWSFLLARVAFHWDSFFRLSCFYFCSTEIEINRTKSEFFFFFIVTSWTGCCRFRTWSRWRSVRRPWRSPSRGWSRCPRGRSCGSPGTWSYLDWLERNAYHQPAGLEAAIFRPKTFVFEFKQPK